MKLSTLLAVAPSAVLAAAVFIVSACSGGSKAEEPSHTAVSSVTQTPAPVPTTPTVTQAPPPTPGPLQYTVVDGDTLTGIGFRFRVTPESILEANGLTSESDLAIGQVLTVPGVTSTPWPTGGPVSTSNDNPIGLHLAMPIAGACLTTNDDQMPNAHREYRAGTHEGVDFFTGFACVDVPKDLPVMSAADGVVMRADKDYRDLTQEQIDAYIAESHAQGFTSPGTLDKFRGRQVWIDHGNGIVTRYCHLDRVPADVDVGTQVNQGDVVGFVGDSGTIESVSNPDFELHLHFEVRVGDSYLAAGLDPYATRALYQAVFGITP